MKKLDQLLRRLEAWRLRQLMMYRKLTPKERDRFHELQMIIAIITRV